MRHRPKLRPRSVPGLLIGGFLLAALPLMAAVAFSVVYVDRLADQSRRLVRQGVTITRTSRQIHTSITAMERAARQYAVLGEPVLARRFRDAHQVFAQALDKLTGLPLEMVPNWDLAALRGQADAVAEKLASGQPNPAALEQKPDHFTRMRELAQAITDQGDASIDKELASIESTADEVRFFLLLCVFALVPATFLLVILLTSVISRPIRQIEAAVRRLGEGEFSRPARISAPSVELEALGQQLEWLRRRLAQLESEKNQFLRHMSHELKTPLASIREGVELIRDGTLGPLSERQAEVADILQRNSLELMALIENLLNFAAWQQQRTSLEAAHCDLRAVAAQVIARHRLTLDARGLVIDLPPAGLQVWADPEQLRLILDNLVANAVKFSPRRGKLAIGGWHDQGTVVIEVRDEGPGVPQSEREHIFAPFYQAHEAGNSHVRGTGIGLSVVRECVRAHEGDIEVDEGPGKGAIFRFRLPDRNPR